MPCASSDIRSVFLLLRGVHRSGSATVQSSWSWSSSSERISFIATVSRQRLYFLFLGLWRECSCKTVYWVKEHCLTVNVDDRLGRSNYNVLDYIWSRARRALDHNPPLFRPHVQKSCWAFTSLRGWEASLSIRVGEKKLLDYTFTLCKDDIQPVSVSFKVASGVWRGHVWVDLTLTFQCSGDKHLQRRSRRWSAVVVGSKSRLRQRHWWMCGGLVSLWNE